MNFDWEGLEKGVEVYNKKIQRGEFKDGDAMQIASALLNLDERLREIESDVASILESIERLHNRTHGLGKIG